MAATMACSSTNMRHNVPVALSRISGHSTTSSMLHLRKQLTSTSFFSLKHQASGSRVVLMMAANGDNISELASEKAVESGKDVAEDTSKLANGQSAASFDVKVEDASDSASYSSDVREKIVDVASDMTVDPADVDDQATKDAKPLAQEYGRSIDDTVEALESKAGEVSDRESRKEN